jgi:hypothetical protein
MIVPGYPDGIDVSILLGDLRFIKLPNPIRDEVGRLITAYKSRALTLDEDAFVRAECRKRRKKIVELHASQDAARRTDARFRLGFDRYDKLEVEARVKTAQILTAKLEAAREVIRTTQEEQKDLGI